jgi:hypothetical protein
VSDDRDAVLQLAVSYWARCVHCAARFRWADHVHAGKHDVREIAAAAGLSVAEIRALPGPVDLIALEPAR